MRSGAPTARRDRLLVAGSLAAVYFIWGSTYLALKVGLDGFPPFILNGIRLVTAGGILMGWTLARGAAPPSGRQWLNSFVIGGLMFVGGLGLVTIAEDQGVGSGLVATGVAVMPLWAALWAGIFGEWPNRLEWLGLLVGFSGVVLLSREGDFQASSLGTLLIVIAPMSWAFGSVVAPRLDLPRGSTSAAAQMLGGGLLLLLAGPIRGESMAGVPSGGSVAAMAYLIAAGSLITYTAYRYLLDTTRAPVATSYAYVNPVVAVVLGVTLGGEIIGVWALVGLPVILLGVAIVGVAQLRRGLNP